MTIKSITNKLTKLGAQFEIKTDKKVLALLNDTYIEFESNDTRVFWSCSQSQAEFLINMQGYVGTEDKTFHYTLKALESF